MSLGKNILKYRKKNGLSQEQLGDKLNVSRQTVSNWEIGETSPNSEQLKKLSKELKVSVDELLDNDYSRDIKKEKSTSEETMTKENEQEGTQNSLRTWQIVLLILGSPLWFSLLIATISIIAAMYIVLLAIMISCWAVFISMFCAALSAILAGTVFAFTNLNIVGFAMSGVGIFCLGLSILLFFVCRSVTKAILLLVKESINCIRSFFLKRMVLQ